jgi:hypothetical protein
MTLEDPPFPAQKEVDDDQLGTVVKRTAFS